MKTIYNYAIGGALLSSLLLSGGCDELGFNINTGEGEGSFLKQSILIDVRDDAETIINGETKGATRAGELDDFKILFFKGNEITPEKSYLYSEMPDIVVLPVGSYKVTATKGVDVASDWESPYYLGESNFFEIREDNINEDIDPIICRLQNIKVSVEFDAKLAAAMSPDSYVEVRVGDNASLSYTANDQNRAGHFKHEDGVSMVATFRGTVEGAETVETKSFDTVDKGYHYKIKFRLHTQNDDLVGEVGASVSVDASVTTVDLENNVILEEDHDLGDEERPKEDIEGEGEKPAPPTPPDQEVTNGPSITAEKPIDLDGVNVITDGMVCVLNIASNAADGFTKFECKVESTTLDIESVGLNNPLDLINPGDSREALEGLGLLEEGVQVKGLKSMKFDLTTFMPLITALGAGEHKFILTVGDASGETTKTLILKSN
ncbi:MAG: DUF4493 domain-containing protein [Bacteroidales bacterium]|nr:DUF4493 domain-containing protein [Bacteroidales bacterium]